MRAAIEPPFGKLNIRRAQHNGKENHDQRTCSQPLARDREPALRLAHGLPYELRDGSHYGA